MKLKLTGNMLVVTSAMKTNDFVKACKLKPGINRIKDEEGNEVFALKFDDSKSQASFSKHSATFNLTNQEGKMEAVVALVPNEDFNEQIVDMYGNALVNTKAADEKMQAKVSQVLASMTELLGNIETDNENEE